MKKVIYTLTLLLFVFFCNLGQTRAQYTQGSNVINLGIGYGIFETGGAPAISASFEHGIVDLGPGIAGTIGLGAILAYEHASYYYYSGVDGFSYNVIFLGARGTWHPNFSPGIDPSKADLYLALDLGFDIVSVSYLGSHLNGYGAAASRLDGGFVIGGRYYFTRNIAGFAELGYDISYFKIGVSFNLASK